MLDEIEERLRLLEETVGIGEDRSIDLNVAELKNTFAQKGFNRVFKVKAEQLLKLKQFTEKPESRPLSEKISFVQHCAEITRNRAAMLQEFEERLKFVLNTDDLAGIAGYEEQLEPLTKDIYAALETVKRNTVEIEKFRNDYMTAMLFMQDQIRVLSERVAQAEAKKRLLESSEA